MKAYYAVAVTVCLLGYTLGKSYVLLPSGSEENEVLLSGSILEGILCPRHFR